MQGEINKQMDRAWNNVVNKRRVVENKEETKEGGSKRQAIVYSQDPVRVLKSVKTL